MSTNTGVIEDEGARLSDDAVADDVSAPSETELSALQQHHINFPNEICSFSLDELIADPKRNGRFRERTIKDDSVKELAQQIKARGAQLTPGEVTLGIDGKYYVTAGTGRYLALGLINSTRAEADHMPFKALVIVETLDNPAQSVIDNAMENWGRLDLSVLDKAKIVKQLMDAPLNLSLTKVCERLGMSAKKRPEVSMLAKIAGFSDQVKEWIADGKIAPYAAYDLAVVEPDKVEETAKKLIDQAGGKRVTRDVAASAVAGKRATKQKKAGGGESRKGKKQRTTRQVLTFINDEATEATAKKYGDKNLVGKLECFAKFLSGGTDETFLKNLAGL